MQTVHRSTDFDHNYFNRNRSDSFCAGFIIGLHNNNGNDYNKSIRTVRYFVNPFLGSGYLNHL